MSRDPLAAFADIKAPVDDEPTADVQDEYYPGSKKKRRAVTGKVDPWGKVPSVTLAYKGAPRTFYSIGVLAEFLNRLPPTVRKWERLGYIPESRYRSVGRGKHGKKRLYTREQIEGLVAIAKEEGLLDDVNTNRNVSSTHFPEKAKRLFEELK